MTVKSFVNENKEYRKRMPYLTIYALPTEEKKLRSQMLIDFAKLQGYEPDQLKRLEDVLARAKGQPSVQAVPCKTCPLSFYASLFCECDKYREWLKRVTSRNE